MAHAAGVVRWILGAAMRGAFLRELSRCACPGMVRQSWMNRMAEIVSVVAIAYGRSDEVHSPEHGR
jgi:hypothetical protein